MLWDDLTHAVRRLRAQPGTAALAAGMLAVAIGVASAMFTIADHLLIRPVPYRNPSTLVTPYVGSGPNIGVPYVSPAVARAWRSSRAFSSVQVVVQRAVVLDAPAGPVTVPAMWISPGTFDLLGVPPALGRTFVPGEGRSGSEDRIIISDRLWQRQFGRDPQIFSRRVRIDGVPVTIVGVMPPRFHFPYWNTDLWRPYDLDAPTPAASGRPLMTYARLAPGVPRPDAERMAMAAVQAAGLNGQHVILRGVADGFLDDYTRTAIAALAGGVGLVFLVLCANGTNLMLARTTARRREFGVCSALGASRTRLLRQAFIEVLLTAGAGASAGLLLGDNLVTLGQRFLPEDLLARTLNPVQVDIRAVVATAVLGCVAAIVAGVPPAWIGTALNPIDSMRATGRSGSETRASRQWSRALLIGEVALATALVAGAGVLVTSFAKLMRIDPGMRLQGVTVVTVSLPTFSFEEASSRATFADHLLREVSSLPGVERAALSFGNPIEGGAATDNPFRTDHREAGEQHLGVVAYSYVGPGFFHVYGIDVLQGRDFAPGDGTDTAIVSARLAAALWPGESAVGHVFTLEGYDTWYRVVGVSREVHGGSFLDPLTDSPEFYTPLTGGSRFLSVGLRCTGSCPDERVIRARVHAVSADAIVSSVQPLDAAYREEFDRPRAAAGLAFAFAAVSLFAAAGGLFSVLSYAVRRRRREFGIRVAMGARPQAIRRLVLADGFRVAVVGLAFGALGSWMLARVLSALAFGVSVRNPLVWTVTAGTIAAAALLAAWVPAISAMRTDPLVLLRDE